jgi:hypothetical protein
MFPTAYFIHILARLIVGRHYNWLRNNPTVKFTGHLLLTVTSEVNKITITAISIISVVMLSIGIGIVMVPPIVFEVIPSYTPDSETLIEQTINSPLITSKLPTLSSTLLILGLVGLGVRGLLLTR